MATLVDPVDPPAPFGGVSGIKNTASPTASTHHFDEGKYYLLVVIGELVTDEHLKCAIADIEKGIRSWDTNLIDCNLDLELKLFVSRHSARFSADVRGQKILHHKSNVLETVVLINPSDEAVSTEVRLMVSDTAHHKLLVLLLLRFAIFTSIGELLSTIHPANKASLTLFCPEHGDWKNSNLDKHNLQDFIHMKLNTPTILPEMEGLSEFTEYLSESVEIPSPFDMLEPPTSGGFLKLSKPCCYIFPGGRGDSALFAVNGFNMLINGGSDRKSCFWKLVRHLDRVDSVLLTHIGDDNLPGINSMLRRKIAELEEEQSQGSTANSDWTKNMISPDIGVMFVNMPQNLDNLEPNYKIRKNAEEASLMLEYLNKLSLKPEPLHRNIGNTVEPIILFQKMGVGKLEMYVLNPAENSKELQYFLKEWTGSDKDKSPILLPNGKESELPISYLSSISSLIVWHPANPSEKIIRVLFPGNSTQSNILEGLEKLKHLDFLKHPVITQKELNSDFTPTLKQAKMKHKTDSKESLKSTSKPSPSKNLQKESKEESPEKLTTLSKTDSVKTLEPTQKIEKKEKTLVKKVKTGDKDSKSKIEQTPKIDTPEKKKADLKPKTIKKETKKSLEKSEADKKAEKPTPKKEEKAKKEEVKKEIKRRVIKKDSLLKESRKDEKKETQKDEKEPKKDLRKVGGLKKNAPSTPEVKKPAPKPKVAARGKGPGSPAKSKEKAKSKPTKKDAGEPVEAPSISSATAEEPAVEASVTDVLEAERSLMSSPEDLTKDFEALKAEEIAEVDEILLQTKIDDSDQGRLIKHEEITPCKESPEAAESLDEGIATTEAEEECGGTPGDLEPNQKSNGTSEKFEDEGTGLEESSEIGDYEEKGDTEEVDEQDRAISKLKDDGEQVEQETKEGSDYVAEEPHDKETELQSFDVTTPPKISAPASPAVSIHDETLPAGLESEVASDDENRDEPPEEYTTSGHTQSTIEISSVPTPMDEMSTPRDVMSDETTNDESDSPSQDFVKYGMTTDNERKTLSPLQDLPELDHSKSDATEGHDYHASASTISPPSSLEEDKSAKEFLTKETFSFDSIRLSATSTTLPLVRSPSGDQNVNVDHVHAGVSSPIELGTTLTGMSKGMESYSPDEKTLEGPLSPQSSGHTPYYQSPVEEKAGTLPLEKTPESQGPIIVDITSDKEYSPKEASPIDEAVPVLQMGKKQSPSYEAHLSTHFELDHKTPSHTDNNDKKLATDDSSSVTSATSLPLTKVETLPDTNPFTPFKEDSKMSISEGTTSDKSGTPVDEVVAEDTFSHIASASTASLATSSLPEPTTDDVSPSLHAEVGSPHSTEVDDRQNLEKTPPKTGSPSSPTVSSGFSPKTEELKLGLGTNPFTDSKSPTSPKKTSPAQHSPSSNQTDIQEKFSSSSTSYSYSWPDTPSVTTPSQIGEPREDSPNVGHFSESVTPKQSPHNQSPLSSDSSLVLGGLSTSHEETDKDKPSPSSFYKETGMDKIEDRQNLEKTPPKTGSPSSPTVSSGFSPKTEELKLGLGTNPFTDSKSPTSPKKTSPAQHSPSSNQTDIQEKFSSSSTSYSYSCQYGESTKICDGGSIGPDTSKTSPSQSQAVVDLCLVTSCEYRHPKTELSPSFINPSPLEYFMNEEHPLEEEKPVARSGGGPPPPGGKQQSKQCEETPPTSVSESVPSQTDSDVPPGTEECPSITAEANIDSEDDSETLPTDRTITCRHADPPPVTPRDPAPAPPHPDACMVDPEVLKAEEVSQKDERGKPKKNISSKTKPSATKSLSKTSAIKDSKVSSPKKTPEDKDAKNATNTSASRGVKSSTSGSTKFSSGTSVPNCPPMYMDLVYIPNHCNAKNVDAEFFKRIRSSYYVVSGNDPTAQEPSKAVLDALLEGKSQWGNTVQVTLIPTHDTEVMREWYQETHEKQQDLNIMVLASSSTVVMQDESFPACKIEL
uniref:Microtubule-associated protein 1B n=1 Tax=Cyprinus carpio TaxID=7962 RepID=A0A8C2EDU0_CYPCA